MNSNIEKDFDLDSLKVSSNFAETMPVQKSLITIPVKKPEKQWFIRVHEDPAWSIDVGILEIKEDRENYLVDRSLLQELANEVVIKRLFTAITRQGSLFLWPIRMPSADGKLDDWNRSAFDIAEKAKKDWVRIFSNMDLGAYEPFIALMKENFAEPEWPEESLSKILSIAFKDRFIKSLDHPVIKKLRGAL